MTLSSTSNRVTIVPGSSRGPIPSLPNHTSRCRRCLPPERREGLAAAARMVEEEEEVAAVWMVVAVGQREKGIRISPWAPIGENYFAHLRAWRETRSENFEHQGEPRS
ncbi:hypothetical protein PIB30_068269 [Stylosanthes scabra]|uniref:Uncharacterized protein n=1 Tax=Stylosanthes scabra TaxID=79078 RepID=A0ABU6YLR2_9FABA|nr:hypothetical protein [Stylosanthes scabra]